MPIRITQRRPIPTLLEIVAAQPLVQFQSQLRPRWCWAACAAMALEAFGRPKTQCAIAGDHLGVAGGCCGLTPEPCTNGTGGGSSSACDKTLLPAHVTTLWASNLVTARPEERALSMAELQASLNAGHPVQLWWDGINSILDHVLLVVGEKSPDWFIVADPCGTGFSFATHHELKIHRGGWRRTWILENEHG
jgi:hypothetical protein